MRIAHLTSAHPRDDVRIRLKECQSLVNAGHDVTLLVADGLGSEVVQGLSIVDIGRPTGRLQRMLLTPRRMLARARGLQVDVCHLHDPELLPIATALRRSGKRVVFDAHEDVPKQILAKHYLPPMVRRTISRVFAAYERHVCARLDGVVAATPTIRDKFLPIHPRTVDINNFPLPGELDSISADARTGAEVCYIGGIASIRGAHEMVAAMGLCNHPGASLNLVGTFSEASLESQLRAMAAWKHVVAWGQLDRAGVREVLARSRVGLVTLHPTANYVESLPIKMFEYMAAGVAVVASDFPLWRSIVSEAECGVCVDPMDAKAIAATIDALLADPTRTSRLGENGRRAITDRFNWRIEEGKLLDFYIRMAGPTA
jgi:glycosyltransferase involved in cell wall biosynthesis